MKKITKILSIIISTMLMLVMMTGCSEGSDGTVSTAASEMQEKLANAGYGATATYDLNSRVSIVSAKCELSFKYGNQPEKFFATDWVSANYYPSEKDAQLGYDQAKKVQGSLILEREGDVVYLGTESAVEIFKKKIPNTIEEGKAVMSAANYTVSDVELSSSDKTANVTKKYKAVLNDEDITVYYFEDGVNALNYYSRNKNNNKNKVFEKQGNFVYVATEAAAAIYKGIENINVMIDSYKQKMIDLGYKSTYAYKKGMAGSVKAKKQGSEWDLQVSWFTNEKSANDAYEYLKVLFKSNVDKGQIKIVLEGKILIVGTEEAIADFKS